MADPISYDKPPQAASGAAAKERYDDAYAELDELVHMLHRRGVFRLIYDFTGSLSGIGQILADDIDSPGGRNGASNLYLLMRMLSRIPPKDLQRILEAVAEGFERMGENKPPDQPYPPGLTGVRTLLRDEGLWQALGPVLEGMKAFTTHLQRSDIGGSHGR